MVDADDSVGHRLAVRELHGEFGTGIHGGLRLGVYDRGRAVLGDVGSGRLLLVERPVLSLFLGYGLHSLLVGLLLCTHEIATVGTGVDRVGHLVELVADGTGYAGAGEHDYQADNGDNQYVLDDRLASETGTPRRYPSPWRKCRCMHMRLPSLRVGRYRSSVGAARVFAVVLPLRQWRFRPCWTARLPSYITTLVVKRKIWKYHGAPARGTS